MYDETGIDISLIAAYHHKFYHQIKKNNRMSSAVMFVFVGINHLLNVLKSVLSILTESSIMFC